MRTFGPSFTKSIYMFQKIKTHFRLHKWYILAIVGLLGGGYFYFDYTRKQGAETLLKAKNQVWFVRQTYSDIHSGFGDEVPEVRRMLDTLVLNGLADVQDRLSKLPIKDPER